MAQWGEERETQPDSERGPAGSGVCVTATRVVEDQKKKGKGKSKMRENKCWILHPTGSNKQGRKCHSLRLQCVTDRRASRNLEQKNEK